MGTAKAFGWVVVVTGVWEILAPFIIGYSAVTGALVDAIILGILLLGGGLITGLSRNNKVVRTFSWIDALFGLWLILAPFIFSYSKSTGALVNDIIVGIVVLVFAIWGAVAAGKDA